MITKGEYEPEFATNDNGTLGCIRKSIAKRQEKVCFLLFGTHKATFGVLCPVLDSLLQKETWT